MKHESIFIFGSAPALAREELHAVLGRLHVSFDSYKHNEIIEHITCDIPLDFTAVGAVLGGTVKAGQVVVRMKKLDPAVFADMLAQSGKKVTFGFSLYGQTAIDIPVLCDSIKELLKQKDISSRFVRSTDGTVLSSVVVGKQSVNEFLIVPQDDEFLIAKTAFVQDVDAWSARDYGRPNADAKKGMLPLKVARMMVNLGIGSRNPAQTSVADLFCGMGSIFSEAVTLGCKKIFGCDIAQQSVNRAVANIEWLKKEYGLSFDAHIICGDATHAHDYFKNVQFDCIVTEPYMGPVFEKGAVLDRQKIANTIKGLQKLYIGSLREWHSLLVDDGRVVMVFPQMQVQEKGRAYVYTVKNVIDRCEKLGYTLMTGPLTYARPNAVVRRQIYILKKLPTTS